MGGRNHFCADNGRMDLRTFDLPRYLATLPLFQDVGQAERERLAVGCRLKRYGRGEDIFRMGEPCEEMHVTVTGQVKLFGLAPSGQEKVIELCGPGQSFAEAIMFLSRPYFVNAQALTDSLVLSVGKAAVVAEIEADSRFALSMLAGIARRLHVLVQDVQAYALASGMQRVIGYLLQDVGEEDEAGVGPMAVQLPASKATIASRLSITPEYFSRVLHELEAHGLIEIDKRDIRIPDPERLAKHQP